MTTAQCLIEDSPWLVAMIVLVGCSAFFSCSEAALFYLRRQDRRRLSSGNAAQRQVAALMDDPDRLLSAVLFWNLVINITFFAIAAIVSLHLGREGLRTEAGVFAVVSLLTIISLSEMLPKSVAVLQSRLIATAVSIPLAASVRALDPLMPTFRLVNLISRRLFFPNFKPEQSLKLGDVERAIELSTSDVALLEQERAVLHNIVTLSDIRVDELMRPRTQFLAFRPPVSLSDLKGCMTPSGYLLVTETDSEEIAGAIPLKHLFEIPDQHLEHIAEKVIYVPWCTSAAEALDQMRRLDREVAAVVNEYGETIGIVTFDDILDTAFGQRPSRSARVLQTSSIAEIEPGAWHVTGMTSVRRLARYFRMQLPSTKSVTVAGIIQEVLQRMPAQGDVCHWGPFRFEVLELAERGQLTVLLTRAREELHVSGQEDAR